MKTNKQRFTLEEKDNKLIVNAYRKLLRHSKSIVSKSDTINIRKAFRETTKTNINKRSFSNKANFNHAFDINTTKAETLKNLSNLKKLIFKKKFFTNNQNS